MRGPRPTAMSTSSAVTVSVCPFLFVKLTVPSATALTAHCRWNVTPRFSNTLRSRLAMSPSRAGRHSLRNSTTVTCVPKAEKMLANSMPMTPAPMMQSDCGNRSSCNRSLESRMRPWRCSKRSVFGSEPVAMTMAGAV